jgi:predicted Zn-dependent protease
MRSAVGRALRSRRRTARIVGRAFGALGQVGREGQIASARVGPMFGRTIESFRPLSPAEAENIRPNRVDFYTARAGDTWQAIAERHGKGVVKASTLAMMNGHAVNDQPRDGERVKIVVGG